MCSFTPFIFIVALAVTQASGERLKCSMIPLETNEGLMGYCCVFFKNSSAVETQTKQIINMFANQNKNSEKTVSSKGDNQDNVRDENNKINSSINAVTLGAENGDKNKRESEIIKQSNDTQPLPENNNTIITFKEKATVNISEKEVEKVNCESHSPKIISKSSEWSAPEQSTNSTEASVFPVTSEAIITSNATDTEVPPEKSYENNDTTSSEKSYITNVIHKHSNYTDNLHIEKDNNTNLYNKMSIPSAINMEDKILYPEDLLTITAEKSTTESAKVGESTPKQDSFGKHGEYDSGKENKTEIVIGQRNKDDVPPTCTEGEGQDVNGNCAKEF